MTGYVVRNDFREPSGVGVLWALLNKGTDWFVPTLSLFVLFFRRELTRWCYPPTAFAQNDEVDVTARNTIKAGIPGRRVECWKILRHDRLGAAGRDCTSPCFAKIRESLDYRAHKNARVRH